MHFTMSLERIYLNYICSMGFYECEKPLCACVHNVMLHMSIYVNIDFADEIPELRASGYFLSDARLACANYRVVNMMAGDAR